MTLAGRKPGDNESAARDIAAVQFGLISRRQADSVGILSAAVTRRVQMGLWERVLPTVYRIAGVPASGAQTAMAATLWAGDGSLVSHGTAAALWKFDGVRSRKVEVWTTRSLKSGIVEVHKGTRLDRADRTTLGGIPVTTPVRTLIDISGRLEDLKLSGLLESLVKRELVDPVRLAARLEALRGPGRTGAGRLEALLEARGEGPAMESTFEALVWAIILESGVRLPLRQHWVKVPGGRYRLDFAWPDLMLGVECDSWEHHARTKADFGKDRARYAELAIAGYRILPVTWEIARRDANRLTRWLRTGVAEAA